MTNTDLTFITNEEQKNLKSEAVEIDQMVYQPYSLTEEEIRIVEGEK